MAILPAGGYALAGTSNNTSDLSHQLFFVIAATDGSVLLDTVFFSEAWTRPVGLIYCMDGNFAIGVKRTSADEAGNFYSILKVNSTGQILWETQLQNQNEQIELADLIELPDSTLLIAGKSTQAGNTHSDMMFSKLAYDGHVLWTRYHGYELSEWVASICLTNQNVIGVAGNRITAEGNPSPQILTIDTAANMVHEFFDNGIAEVTHVSYNEANSTLFFAWNNSSNGVPKSSVFNFTIDLFFGCNAMPSAPFTAEFDGVATCPTPEGNLMMCGNMHETGPGIVSMFIFKVNGSCQHNNTLQVGVKQLDSNADILAYPNPADAFITLDLTSLPAGTGTAELRDLSGRLVFSKTIYTGNEPQKLDVAEIPAGFYILNMASSHGSFSKPMIIKH
jgi:hypothetical protein